MKQLNKLVSVMFVLSDVPCLEVYNSKHACA